MTKHVSLRLTPDLHHRLVVAANYAHRSLNGQVEWYIELGVAKDEDSRKPPAPSMRPGLEAMVNYPEAFDLEGLMPAFRRALGAETAVTKGDVIRIIPERGPERVMLVVHVEHHIITLADLDSTSSEGGARDAQG
jgi:hypothetical protein